MKPPSKLDWCRHSGCIDFWAAGIPKPQPRAKARNMGAHAGVYDPGTANGWKECVFIAAQPHKPPMPIQGPVKLLVNFFLPRPDRLNRKKDPVESIPHIGHGDFDNFIKAVADVLTNMGFWLDDRQVYDGHAIKWYVGKGCAPGAHIMITPLMPAETPPR